MSGRICAQETDVARAVRTGEWSAALQGHLRDCASCRSVREAASWMQALAPAAQAPSQGQDGLPDPQILWLRAQFSERQAAAERAQKMAQWVEVACVAAVCAGLGIWLASSWNEIGGELGWAIFDAWPAFWSGVNAYGPVNAPVLFASALAAIAVVTIGIAYPLLGQE